MSDDVATVSLNLDGTFETGADRAAAAGDRLTTSLGGVAKAAGGRDPLAPIRNAAGKPTLGQRAAKPIKPPWSDADWNKGPSQALSGITANIAALKRQQQVAKGGGGADGGGDPSLKDPTLKYLAKQAGVSKQALRAPVAAAAVDATKLALGLRGMAQLDALGMRASMNLRQLFRGVDAQPVVRGADRFLQVLNPASATGKAMEGIFKRTFNSIFGDIEKIAPIAQTVFQGLVLGALQIEEAWLDARIALFPVTSAISDMVGPTNTVSAGAKGATVALGAMALAATGAAAPLVAAAAAWTLAYSQYQKLKTEMGAGGAQAVERSKFKVGSAEAEGAYGIKGVGADEARDAHEAFMASRRAAGVFDSAPAATDGKATGAALADGMVEGMDAGLPLVQAAGKRLGAGGAAGAREGADAHSPSRKTYKTGRDMGDGAELGLDSKAADVQAAGERSLVPDVSGRSAGASKGSAVAPGAPSQITVIHQWPAGVRRSDDIEAAAEAGTYRAIRALAGQLAVPTRLTP